jgi:phosphatidate cytidylyltransferase
MKTRAITAFFFTIVMLGSIFLGGYTFTFFYLILSLAALVEFFNMIKTAGIKPHRYFALFVSALIFLITAIYQLLGLEMKFMLLIVHFVFFIL